MRLQIKQYMLCITKHVNAEYYKSIGREQLLSHLIGFIKYCVVDVSFVTVPLNSWEVALYLVSIK